MSAPRETKAVKEEPHMEIKTFDDLRAAAIAAPFAIPTMPPMLHLSAHETVGMSVNY